MKKGLKNYLYQTAYQLLIVLTPLLTAPCLARALGTEGIGIYSYRDIIYKAVKDADVIIIRSLGTFVTNSHCT